MTDVTNPYRPPDNTEGGDPTRIFAERRGIIVLPLLIPLFAHMLSRTAIPPDDSPYHAVFTFGAILPTCICACFITGRLLLLSRKTYVATCVLFASLVAVVLVAYPIT